MCKELDLALLTSGLLLQMDSLHKYRSYTQITSCLNIKDVVEGLHRVILLFHILG